MTTEIKASLHFAWPELACHDGTTYPQDYRTDPSRLPALLNALESVRDEACQAKGRDVPLVLSSVYRTEAYQRVLQRDPVYKAAKNSQHVQGRAADILCPRDLVWDEFVCCVERAAARVDSPIRYIELRPTLRYIHVDVRLAAKLVIETV